MPKSSPFQLVGFGEAMIRYAPIPTPAEVVLPEYVQYATRYYSTATKDGSSNSLCANLTNYTLHPISSSTSPTAGAFLRSVGGDELNVAVDFGRLDGRPAKVRVDELE